MIQNHVLFQQYIALELYPYRKDVFLIHDFIVLFIFCQFIKRVGHNITKQLLNLGTRNGIL